MLTLLILIAMSLLPLCIKLNYRRENNDDKLQAAISFFGGPLPVRINIPVARLRGKELELEAETGSSEEPLWEHGFEVPLVSQIKSLQQLKTMLVPFKKQIDFFFQHSRWQALCINVAFSSGNAAATGLMFGILSGVSANIERFLQGIIRFKKGSKAEINIRPEFASPHLRAEVRINLFIRLGFLIYVTVRMLLLMRKGGRNSG